MNKRQSVKQIDNPTHVNMKKDRKKALKVLELAKSQNHKIVILPKGYTPDFERLKLKCKKNK